MSNYLEGTLHYYLSCKCENQKVKCKRNCTTGFCKCKPNCILKSLSIWSIQDDVVYINAEPYDNAYNFNDMEKLLDKLQRVIFSRRVSIFRTFKATHIDVSVYDEMRPYGNFSLNKKDDRIYRQS